MALYAPRSHFTASANTGAEPCRMTTAAALAATTAPSTSSTILERFISPPECLLLQTKHPDHAAFRHVRVMSRCHAVDARFHRPRVLSPSRSHCDVLFAIDHK